MTDDTQREQLAADGTPAQPKKRTTKRKQQHLADDQSLPGEGGGAKKKRATRKDKGMPRLGERDLIVLRWIMHMYAVRFDQLQVLLARHSPKRKELKDPDHVSGSTVRTHLDRWEARKLIEYDNIYASKDEPLWCWLSPFGLKYLANEPDEDGKMIVYSYFLPKPNYHLPHMFLINQARLYIELQYPDYTWRSERQLIKLQAARPKGIKQRHMTDGLMVRPDGREIALEVERWDKAEARLEAILRELAQTYHRTWYFASKAAYKVIMKAREKLPEVERLRIQVLKSEVKLLGQPEDKEDTSEEISEE